MVYFRIWNFYLPYFIKYIWTNYDIDKNGIRNILNLKYANILGVYEKMAYTDSIYVDKQKTHRLFKVYKTYFQNWRRAIIVVVA